MKTTAPNKKPSFVEGFFNTSNTYIHPTSIIGPDVKLGSNVKIGPYSTIIGNVFLDSNTRIHGYVSIGMPAQDLNTKSPLGSIYIGKNSEIREFVTISSPKQDNSQTKIGDNCYIMNFSHIAHDVTLEHNVTLINSVNLAGHVHVEHHAMLMANSAVHQFCKIGAYSALAPFSGMRQDLPPFSLYNGTPGRFSGINRINLKRENFTSNDINAIKTITKLFFHDKLALDVLEKEAQTNELLQNNVHVKDFITFVKNASRGISRKTIND